MGTVMTKQAFLSCSLQPDPDGRRTEITCAACGGPSGP